MRLGDPGWDQSVKDKISAQHYWHSGETPTPTASPFTTAVGTGSNAVQLSSQAGAASSSAPAAGSAGGGTALTAAPQAQVAKKTLLGG